MKKNNFVMKSIFFVGVLAALVFVIGIPLDAYAHPHASFTLMDSHSHELHDEKYQGHFIIHTFEEVVFKTISFFESFLK